MITLASVDAYMIRTFFKTVFLVIVIGAIHGLVFLPVLLSLFVRKTNCFSRSNKEPQQSPSRQSQRSVASSQDKPSGPFGRYGIYLPRLTNVVQYHAGKGEVLQWNNTHSASIAANSLGSPGKALGIMGGRLLPIRHQASSVAPRTQQLSSSTLTSFRNDAIVDGSILADNLSMDCRNFKLSK